MTAQLNELEDCDGDRVAALPMIGFVIGTAVSVVLWATAGSLVALALA